MKNWQKISLFLFLIAGAIGAGIWIFRKRQTEDRGETGEIYTPTLPPIVPNVPDSEAGNIDTTTGQYIVPSFCEQNYRAFAGTAHFQSWEFDCKDGTPVPDSIKGNLQELMENLEVLREELGGAAITVNSGFRTVSHNRNEGGGERSMHLCAKAADIVVAGYPASQVYQTIERLISEGKMKQGGLGSYNSFTHYDVRGSYARW